MKSLLRRLLVAGVRKLLPDAAPENTGTALALRPTAELIVPPESRKGLPLIVRPSQTLYAPPPAPVQPVFAPAPPAHRRRKVVVETITYEERKW